jgi:hypothetical protein
MRITFELFETQYRTHYLQPEIFWTPFNKFKNICIQDLFKKHLMSDTTSTQEEIFTDWLNEGNAILNSLDGDSKILFSELLDNINKLHTIFPLSGVTESALVTLGDDLSCETEEDYYIAENELISSDSYQGLMNLFNFYESIHDMYSCGINKF